MAQLSVGKAPSNLATLPFYAAGALFFLLLTFVLLLKSDVLLGHHFQGPVLAMVHLAALGWGTMVIYGAGHQLLPVLCERNLYSEKLAVLSFVLLTAGVLILSVAFWFLHFGTATLVGGSLVFLSSIIFLINSIATAFPFRKGAYERLFLISAPLWLVFTTGFGLLLVWNLHSPIFDASHLHLLKFHAHAGLAGWFLQLITGVSSKLVPMFLLGKSSKTYLLKWAWILQNLGLILFMVLGLTLGTTTILFLSLLLVFSGTLLWLLLLRDVFTSRLRKRIEPLMRNVAFSFLFLLLSFAMAGILLFYASTELVSLYGTLLFMGWISGIILGKTFKTLPFIIWNTHYKSFAGKKRTPMPKDLFSEKLARIQLYLYAFAMVLMALGLLQSTAPLLTLSAGLWVVLALLYCYQVFKLLGHKNTLQ